MIPTDSEGTGLERMLAAKATRIPGDLSPALPSVCEEAKLGEVRWCSPSQLLESLPLVRLAPFSTCKF